MTALALIALGAGLAWAAYVTMRSRPAPPGRALGGGALLVAAIGLAAVRQFALALPVGMLAIGMLRTAAASRPISQPGRSSEVRTDVLAMRLDHDTGEMDGDVLSGRFEGARLSQLSLRELAALAEDLEADADSLGLLLAYLDRQREANGASASSDQSTPDGEEMSEEQALRILGLAPGASAAEIQKAHHRLIRKMHPDLGGSDAIAAMINAAKARLDR